MENMHSHIYYCCAFNNMQTLKHNSRSTVRLHFPSHQPNIQQFPITSNCNCVVNGDINSEIFNMVRKYRTSPPWKIISLHMNNIVALETLVVNLFHMVVCVSSFGRNPPHFLKVLKDSKYKIWGYFWSHHFPPFICKKRDTSCMTPMQLNSQLSQKRVQHWSAGHYKINHRKCNRQISNNNQLKIRFISIVIDYREYRFAMPCDQPLGISLSVRQNC